MYFEFAITCNDRGRTVAEILRKRTNLIGKRYLDIGCALAGFLVAFAEQGAEVFGIDKDAVLLDLARNNLLDNNLAVELIEGDATSEDALSRFRRNIDIATCNDVIEHVDDPPALLHNIADLLRDDGTAYFEIPNRHHPRHVLSDGHYQLFGITLLDYEQAREYYSHHAPEAPYGVRYYLGIDHYRRLFRQAGLNLVMLEETFDSLDIRAVFNDIAELECHYEAKLSGVPPALRDTVRAQLLSYLSEVRSHSFESSAEDYDFRVRYGAGFWRVLGCKVKRSQTNHRLNG